MPSPTTRELGREIVAGTVTANNRHLIKTMKTPTATKHLAFCGGYTPQCCPKIDLIVTGSVTAVVRWHGFRWDLPADSGVTNTWEHCGPNHNLLCQNQYIPSSPSSRVYTTPTKVSSICGGFYGVTLTGQTKAVLKNDGGYGAGTQRDRVPTPSLQTRFLKRGVRFITNKTYCYPANVGYRSTRIWRSHTVQKFIPTKWWTTGATTITGAYHGGSIMKYTATKKAVPTGASWTLSTRVRYYSLKSFNFFSYSSQLPQHRHIDAINSFLLYNTAATPTPVTYTPVFGSYTDAGVTYTWKPQLGSGWTMNPWPI